MNLKRTLVAVFAAGTMMLSAAAGVSAHPNHEHANCVAHIAHHSGGGEVATHAKLQHIGGWASENDCPPHHEA
jgi:hypothetical protein